MWSGKDCSTKMITICVTLSRIAFEDDFVIKYKNVVSTMCSTCLLQCNKQQLELHSDTTSTTKSGHPDFSCFMSWNKSRAVPLSKPYVIKWSRPIWLRHLAHSAVILFDSAWKFCVFLLQMTWTLRSFGVLRQPSKSWSVTCLNDKKCFGLPN